LVLGCMLTLPASAKDTLNVVISVPAGDLQRATQALKTNACFFNTKQIINLLVDEVVYSITSEDGTSVEVYLTELICEL
jgi:hypothetical protein